MSDWSLELTYPWRLLAIGVVAVVLYYYRHSLVDFPLWQRRLSLYTRLTIILLLVFALAGLTLTLASHEQFLIVLVDQSSSIGQEGSDAQSRYLEQLEQHAKANPSSPIAKIQFLPFEASPGKATSNRTQLFSKQKDEPSATPSTDSPAATNPPPPHGTNLEAAIEGAVASFPPGYVPQIALLSDGNQTTGDALRAALRSEIPISTVQLPTRKEPEAQISSVQLPTQVGQGEPFNVEVVIDSNHEDEGLIQIYRGDHQVVTEQKKLKAGENRFRFQQTIDSERLANFTAQISGLKQDTLLDNNADSGLVYASGKPRILIVESDPQLIREFVTALEQEEIQVDVRPSTGMPDNLSDLQNYEMLILSNVPATALSQRQMEITRTYVQDLGGGFMMLGGEQSFGLGGYYKSVLEEVLPVRSDFEKEKEKPGLGMVLVIDKSGSMDGDKIEMAKTAARSATELLGNSDQVAVIAFDGDTYVISDMQSASNKGRISDDISRIEAGGGTTMHPAMEKAHEILQGTSAKLKHVIVLTDGVSTPGDFEGLAALMAQDKITVSTVAVGSDSDTGLLEEIAKTGNGRYYLTEDPASIPQIFAKETITASKSAIDEQPFVPQIIRASQALKEIDLENAPFLLGYVLTRPKPTSEVILATEKGDPLLVWWRYGLGMSIAFTSDVKSRWSAEWLSWPGYGKFWAQVVRNSIRKSDAKGVAVQVEQRGGKATITLDAVDPAGRFLNQAETEMTLITPRLENQKISLQQTAPGRYTTTVDTPVSGAYHLELTQIKEGQVIYRQSRGLSVGYSDELRLRPPNETLLRSISTTTQGKFNPAAPDLFAPTVRTARRPTPLWPWLTSIAIALLVVDVFLRRLDISLLIGRRPPPKPFRQILTKESKLPKSNGQAIEKSA